MSPEKREETYERLLQALSNDVSNVGAWQGNGDRERLCTQTGKPIIQSVKIRVDSLVVLNMHSTIKDLLVEGIEAVAEPVVLLLEHLFQVLDSGLNDMILQWANSRFDFVFHVEERL